MTLFADDITLTITEETYEVCVQNINHDLNIINEWLIKNKLLLNLKKCNFMVLGSLRNTYKFDINIGTQPHEQIFESKILGIKFNPNLNFEAHINETCNQVLKRISFLSRIRHFLPQKTVKHIFNGLILF